MYESYWGLNESPFSLTPDPRFLYLSKGHEDALSMLHYAITRNKGAAILTGDVGLGKTTITRRLMEILDEQQYKIALVVNPVLTPNQLLIEVLMQLGIEIVSKQRQSLVQQLHQSVFEFYQRGQSVLLIIDEAHLIRNTQAMEELRLMLNCQLNNQFLVNLLLVGQTELREKILKVPALDSRLAIRATLKPLDVLETSELLLHRMKVAGYIGDRLPFTPDAVFQLHKYTNGYPRRMLQLADNALMMSMAKQSLMVDAFLMMDVVQDFEEAMAA